MSEITKCSICGEPMPVGETMFKFHGYSGPCPKPPLLKPHQQRVVDEKNELDAKREKLMAFFSTAMFHGLPESEQSRLLSQGTAMRTYSEILGERIANF